jgi:hypothetical protein
VTTSGDAALEEMHQLERDLDDGTVSRGSDEHRLRLAVIAALAEPPGARAPVDEPAPVAGRAARRGRRRRLPAGWALARPRAPELLAAAGLVAVVVAGLLAVDGSPTARAASPDGAAPVVVAPDSPTDPTPSTARAPVATTTTTVAIPEPEVDITELARRCDDLDGASTDPGFRPDVVLSRARLDPRSGVVRPSVIVGWRDRLGPLETLAPFSIVAAFHRPDVAASDVGPPIDREGSAQLWFTWDGTDYHKGLRIWDGQRWTMAIDEDVPDVTARVATLGADFFWTGIEPGWRYTMTLVTPQGCRTGSALPDGTPSPVAG